MNAPTFVPPGPQIRHAGQVNTGDRVLACYTNSFHLYREPATVSRVNRSSIRVTTESGRNFPLPLAGAGGFSVNNCAYMLERDESKAPGESAMDRAAHLQAKADRREEWADQARARAEGRSGQFRDLLECMNGSPVLVGHHSEKRHRRDLARVDNAMRASVEETRLAERHERRADGLAREAARIERAATAGDALEDARTWLAATCAELRRLKKARGWSSVRKEGVFRGGLEAQCLVRLASGQPCDVWITRGVARLGVLYQGAPRGVVRLVDLSPGEAARAIAGALEGPTE